MENQLEAILKMAEELVKRLRIKPLQDLIAQIRQAMETRRQFAAGTPPRSYERVLSIDAPLPPSAAGAPVYDREGRLVGVSVGVAHHGTSYVVPMVQVRWAFAEHLRGTPRPDRVGRAKLY